MTRRLQALIWCTFLLLSQQSTGEVKAQVAGAARTATANTPKLPTLPSAANAAAQKDDATYFFMDLNGNYKYAFDSGQGYEGEQSGDQANEVSGHYTFYEKGVPYMVRYKAGVHGYQPVVVPADGTGNGAGSGGGGGAAAAQTLAKPVLTQFMQVGNTQANLITTKAAGATTAQTTQTVLPSLQLTLAMPTAGASVRTSAAQSGGLQPTLRFVQDIMRAIQTQPVQISFATQKALLQQANAANGATASTARSALITPTSKAEIQQINALGQQSQTQLQQQQQQTAGTGTALEEVPKRPYTFSYESDRSAHTESADKSGNIVGKYSYYDAAGYHDLSYKAGDDIGFVVMGGSLSNPQAGAGATTSATSSRTTAGTARETSTAAVAAAVLRANAAGGANVPQLVVNVSQDPNINYSYTVEPLPPIESNAVEHNIKTRHGRSLRKFRRFADW